MFEILIFWFQELPENIFVIAKLLRDIMMKRRTMTFRKQNLSLTLAIGFGGTRTKKGVQGKRFMFSFEAYYEDLRTHPIEEGENVTIMSFLGMWKKPTKIYIQLLHLGKSKFI